MLLILLILIFLGLNVIVDGISKTPIMGRVKDPLLGGFYFLNYCLYYDTLSALIRSALIWALEVIELIIKAAQKRALSPVKFFGWSIFRDMNY